MPGGPYEPADFATPSGTESSSASESDFDHTFEKETARSFIKIITFPFVLVYTQLGNINQSFDTPALWRVNLFWNFVIISTIAYLTLDYYKEYVKVNEKLTEQLLLLKKYELATLNPADQFHFYYAHHEHEFRKPRIKRVALVTGAAGFIGSHIVDKLVNSNFDVIGIDDLSTGSLDNLEHLIDNPHFSFIQLDCSSNTLFSYIDRHIDYFVHLAGTSSQKIFMKHQIESFNSIFVCGHNILYLARAMNSTVVVGSSGELYGHAAVKASNGLGEPSDTVVNPYGPRAVHVESIRNLEIYARHHKFEDIDVRVARIFNTYGPRMSYGVIHEFVTAALNNQSLTIFDDGDQTRSFIHIKDLVDILYKMLTYNDVWAPVNLGSKEIWRIKYLAKQINKLTQNNETSFKFEPRHPDEPKHLTPHIERVKHLFDWEPKIKLKDELPNIIKMYKQRMETASKKKKDDDKKIDYGRSFRLAQPEEPEEEEDKQQPVKSSIDEKIIDELNAYKSVETIQDDDLDFKDYEDDSIDLDTKIR